MNPILCLALTAPLFLAGSPGPAPGLAPTLVPTLAATQDPVVTQSTSTGFVLEAGDLAVDDLIANAAKFLGINILTEPNALANNPAPIQISKRVELDYLGCLDLLSSLLYSRGYALVPMDADRGFYEVISMAGQRRSELSTRATFVTAEKVREYERRYEQILTVVELEHVNAQIATNALRPFFAAAGGMPGGPGGITIGNIGRQKHLLLQGFGPHVASALRLLKITDVPDPEDTPELQELVQQLMGRIEALEKKVAER